MINASFIGVAASQISSWSHFVTEGLERRLCENKAMNHDDEICHR
jgi:hypothetical protein